MKKIWFAAIGIVIILIAAGIFIAMSGTPQQKKSVVLSESGSTLLYPVFNVWAKNYTDPNYNVTITTQATGSGTGISSAIKGTVIIGASDTYMSDSLMVSNPGMLNIPILISSQYIAYNIPGLNDKHLVLSGPVIAGIYNNTIQYWDDQKIASLNPGISLPHERIIPVYRSDGSGDTAMFTSFLSKSCQWWNKTVGFGTNVNWPSNPAAHGATGNAGIISFMEANPYTISYIAMTYTNQISGKLGYAALINRAGIAVLPSTQTVMNAASQYLNVIPPDGRISITFAPGNNSYPIATFEYLIVKKVQPDKDTAIALKNFIKWVVDPNGGSSPKYLNQFYLIPLPSSVVNGVTLPLVEQITYAS
ncbi:MAG: phosphate ABC transporter substrate-binding protein PstS [Thermoplasmata archaeon]|jgi:phosphate transport system substrate-binding protein|nr:phosphate ABC transporter substrate-binding protein PstS [Thermoplasmatales archaeon]